ncbi:MAG: hypothetical protein M5U09_27175 [Gammaproteobacteria bacterium]|nr:hypothetical protein [Gammaproteobacteria bacterium]
MNVPTKPAAAPPATPPIVPAAPEMTALLEALAADVAAADAAPYVTTAAAIATIGTWYFLYHFFDFLISRAISPHCRARWMTALIRFCEPGARPMSILPVPMR